MKLKLIFLYLTFALLNLTKAQDTVWLSGTNKVSFKVAPTQLYFVNCSLQYNTATTSVRTISGVGKVLFKPDGSGYIIPVSTFKNGSFTYYATGCKLVQKELIFSTYVAPPKDTIVAPPKDTIKPIGSTGASYISANYNWGRTFGNTSASQFGSELIRALRTPTGVAELNGFVYFTLGLAEGNSSLMRVKNQRRQELMAPKNGDIGGNMTHIVRDGNRLIIAMFDTYKDAINDNGTDDKTDDYSSKLTSAIIVIDSIGRELTFSSGKSFYCTWQKPYNAYKSGIHLRNDKITGLDVDATTLYVYCGTKCYQYNKVTGALNSVVTISLITGVISEYVSGSNKLTMTTTDVRYNGKVICKAQTSHKIDNYTYTPKDFNTYEIKGSVCIGAQYLYVVDAGNCRTLIYDKNGLYLTQIAYLPMNYNCSVDRGNPTRVFAKELEFKVDYSNMSWTLVANWSSQYQYAGDNKVWYYLKDVVTTSAGTFGIVRLSNNRDHDVVKLTDNGLIKVSSYQFPISLTKEGKVIYKQDVNGKSNFYLDGDLKESVNQINGSGYIGLTDDGTFVVYDNSKSTGNHLYWIKSGQVKSAMPTINLTQAQAQSKPFQYSGSYPIDPNVEYAGGTQVQILGNDVYVNYVGEFFGGSGGQTNLFYKFNNGNFIKRVGMTSWEAEAMDGNQAPRLAGGNSYGFGVVSVNGKTYIILNCEHTGALQWFEF